MGCDIHIYREKLVDGQWLTADNWKPREHDEGLSHDEVGGGRNYALFYCLAGVRPCGSEHPFSFTPRGMPIVLSAEVQRERERWDGDGHSHSFLYLHELEELLSVLDKSMVTVVGAKPKADLARLRSAIAANEPGCWDLLYPFLQVASDTDYFESFSIEVPASHCVRKQLCEIIDGLRAAGGDLQRIVFWFDN